MIEKLNDWKIFLSESMFGFWNLNNWNLTLYLFLMTYNTISLAKTQTRSLGTQSVFIWTRIEEMHIFF